MKTSRKNQTAKKSIRRELVGYTSVLSGAVELLDTARRASARAVNALMTATYWELGKRIMESEQRGEIRAGYGEELIVRLSVDLTKRFGRGFSERNLDQMRFPGSICARRFAE